MRFKLLASPVYKIPLLLDAMSMFFSYFMHFLGILSGFVTLLRIEKIVIYTWCAHFLQYGTVESFIRMAWTHSPVMREAYKDFVVLLKYWLTWEVKRLAWRCKVVSDTFRFSQFFFTDKQLTYMSRVCDEKCSKPKIFFAFVSKLLWFSLIL
jgi:hypothetical protein